MAKSQRQPWGIFYYDGIKHRVKKDSFGKPLEYPTKTWAEDIARDEREELGDRYQVVVKKLTAATLRRANPMARRATKAKSKAASRYGVYVGSSSSPTLAYVSTKKLDANKAASKLKLSGRIGIKIKAVGPNPISGKVPKVGWRKEYAKAAYAAVKAPGARRKRAATTGKIRRALNSSGTGMKWAVKKASGYQAYFPTAAKAKARAKQVGGTVYHWSKGQWVKYSANSAISIVGPSRARRAVGRSVNPPPKVIARDEGMFKGQTDGYEGLNLRADDITARAMRSVGGMAIAKYLTPAQVREAERSWVAGYKVGHRKGKRQRVGGKANPARKRNAASILMRRANPKAKAKRKASKPSAPRTRYMVQVGETPAWVGKLKSDANKAWRKLNAAGMKSLKIFKVQVNKVVKDGWRKAFKSASTGAKRNPSFPGRKGSGQRFKACVASVSKRPGVYDPEGLCAAIGRRKYGAKGMAKLARKGRNPQGPYFVAATGRDGRTVTKEVRTIIDGRKFLVKYYRGLIMDSADRVVYRKGFGDQRK